jgi:hypothetical protein
VRLERSGRGSSEETTRGIVAHCAILILALWLSTGAGAARFQLTCITKKVVITDKPAGSSSSQTTEDLIFWIDEASKSVSFGNGTPLSIQRLDERWISASAGGVAYEIDRESKNVTYAGTSMNEGVATIIIGSGTCTVEQNPR